MGRSVTQMPWTGVDTPLGKVLGHTIPHVTSFNPAAQGVEMIVLTAA